MTGVVVCPQPRAADIGADILARGGNAFDAALATAFAQMVHDPFMCGMGGMGTMVWFRADTGEAGSIDFYNRAGAKVTPDMWAKDFKGRTEISGYTLFNDYRSEIGYTAIMTPGTLAGLGEAHARHGSLPWAELIAPAAQDARDGIVVTPHVRNTWIRYRQPGIPDGKTRIRATAECARIFLRPDGEFFDIGETVRNPDMADTLDIVADKGPQEFYTGELGARIAADLAANGSYVTAGDLRDYRPQAGKPLESSYRGYTVYSNPPPGSGATLIEMLNILEHFDLGATHHSSAEHVDLVARAMAAAHADRNEHLGDPAHADVPTEMLISKDRAAKWAEKIKEGAFLGDGKEAPPSCTTHLGVQDAQGNAVALTHTLGTSAGVVTPGLGFVYNNSMKLFDPLPGRRNSMAAGKARTTGMCPTIFVKDGRARLVCGAPGGSVIISAVLQSILNVVDFGMTAIEAVTVPRIHCEGGRVHAEATVPLREIRRLEAMGHEVEHMPYSFGPSMSRAHIIETTHVGRVRAGSDPRGGAGVSYAW
ncbi:MAG: gamma-glutamyltransferase [Acetobacterales bacterium]